MPTAEQVIAQTQKWITDVVVGCNFCPFAAREVKRNSIYYQVETSGGLATCLQAFLNECRRLDKESIETTLLILPEAFPAFKDYLELVDMAEQLLKQEGYEGIYQVAGFHPLYAFAGAPAKDAANFTNRSPYPMLHLLREESIEKALEKYPNPDAIPQHNIDFAREKGFAYMEVLRNVCMSI